MIWEIVSTAPLRRPFLEVCALLTLRDGAIKASIWRNASEKGAFYSVEFSRTYKSGEVFQDSGSFGGSDLLKISRLAEAAYAFIADRR